MAGRLTAAPLAGYERILDRHHLICIDAKDAGKHTDPEQRRWPALEVVEQIRRKNEIDHDCVVAGGFSGGERGSRMLAIIMPDGRVVACSWSVTERVTS